MRIIVCENYEEVSQKAAEIVASQVILKPDCVLGLATGSTPVGMYEKLGEMNASGKIDFSSVTSFNLDEYYPIKRNNPQSYYSFMENKLFSKINIKRENTHIPNGECTDPEKECEEYEKLLMQKGGVDLQILGIGRNGHIGFNEPDPILSSVTHLVKLTDSTIKANSRFFDSMDEVPKHALTMGMRTILSAKKIILMASGVSKSRIISEFLDEGINMAMPAALLKTHPDVVLICDKDAYVSAKLGVDIGGTNIKFAVLDGENVKHKCQIKTADTEEKIINDICETIKEIQNQYHIKSVGIGTPGFISKGLVTATNLPFTDTPLERMIAEKTGLDVTVDNDANCAALGEMEFGATKDCDNIVLVTLGTGIGGGIIINRRIYQGKNAGEIGHMIIETENGLECKCGQKGCWEKYASTKALMQLAMTKMDEDKTSILYEAYLREGELSGKVIFNAYEANCPVARNVVKRYVAYLSAGIKNLKNIFGPDAIVLSGGITESGEKLFDLIKEEVGEDVRIEISRLQNDAGAMGAAML